MGAGAFFGDVVLRINPVDAKVDVVGRAPDGPHQLAFAGSRVYVAHAVRLRRIKDLRVRGR